ncbi:MAG: hypothetical protein ABIR47_07460 [Candidatus Kapaibacterium sp.]
MPENTQPVDPALKPSVEGTPADSPVEPEKATQTPPVEPEAPQKSSREIDLEKALEEERSKTSEARNADRKRREALKQEREQAGNFKALYDEASSELTTVATERDTLKAQVETANSELISTKKELTDFRSSIESQFQEADRELVKGLPLPSLLAAYKRFYGADLIPGAGTSTPSVGSQKPASAAGITIDLETAKATGDPKTINSAFDKLLEQQRSGNQPQR